MKSWTQKSDHTKLYYTDHHPASLSRPQYLSFCPLDHVTFTTTPFKTENGKGIAQTVSKAVKLVFWQIGAERVAGKTQTKHNVLPCAGKTHPCDILFFLISVILFFFPFKIIKSRLVKKKFFSFLLKENFIFQREKSLLLAFTTKLLWNKKKDLRGKKSDLGVRIYSIK